MAKCPKCGKENIRPASSWTGGAKTAKPMEVQRFVCSSCGTGYVVWPDSATGVARTMVRKG